MLVRLNMPLSCRPSRTFSNARPHQVHRVRRFLSVLIASLGLLVAEPIFSGVAHASLVPALELADLTRLADRVVLAEVLSVESAWDSAHRRIITTVEVQVAETWKGTAPGGGKLVIAQVGGTVGDIEMKVHGMPTFRVGDRAVLFLHGSEAASGVLGLGQGKHPVRYDLTANRWMVDGGDRSAAVLRDADGHFRPAPSEATTSLDDLRARVRKLVQP